MVFFRLVPYLRVRNNLRRLAADNPGIADPIFSEWSEGGVSELKVEPYPAPTGGGYIRTYRLPTGWLVKKLKKAVFEIINTVDYAGYVVKRNEQAQVHFGRWWTAEDVLERRLPILHKNLRAEYVKVWTA